MQVLKKLCVLILNNVHEKPHIANLVLFYTFLQYIWYNNKMILQGLISRDKLLNYFRLIQYIHCFGFLLFWFIKGETFKKKIPFVLHISWVLNVRQGAPFNTTYGSWKKCPL